MTFVAERHRENSNRLPPTGCVIRVGEGRGFVVEHRYTVKLDTYNRLWIQRLVITAAHCLPKLPPAHAFSYTEDRTYANLLGPLRGEASAWAECLFADPVRDIAVLGEPDNQELSKEYDAFFGLVEGAPVVRIGSRIGESGWVLSLDGEWVEMPLRHLQGPYGSSLSTRDSKPGQSGSPILNDSGEAVGVIAIGTNQKWHGPQPMLCRDLPARYLPG
jgi:hypothetical protein